MPAQQPLPQPGHLFVFGLGYTGLHLAETLCQKGWQITATTRTPQKLRDKQDKGWKILAFEAGSPVADIERHLFPATHLISTIGPVNGHDCVLDAHEQALAAFTGWTGYLSATSVYPDTDGGWVDETTQPAPTTGRGTARLAAERRWAETANAELFRIAGIYGPGRTPFGALKRGEARIIDRPGHVFNRIHQSDITAIITAAMAQPRSRRIINLADRMPAPQGEVIAFAAALLGVTPPEPVPLEQAGLSAMAKSFYAAHRRVRSTVIEPELGVSLAYPDYRTGLRALFEAGCF